MLSKEIRINLDFLITIQSVSPTAILTCRIFGLVQLQNKKTYTFRGSDKYHEIVLVIYFYLNILAGLTAYALYIGYKYFDF